MNFFWPRILKSAYRQEPISSFLILVGVVDATIGGVGSYGSLTFVGLTTVGGALAFRWWQLQRTKPFQPERVAEHYLPAQSSRPQLPMLSIAKKRPPH